MRGGFANVHIKAGYEGQGKEGHRKNIHDIFSGRDWSQLCKQKMNVRIAFGGVSQFFSHLPMPVCEKTISESIKYSQDKPGESCQQQGDQIPSSQGAGDPAKKVEHDQPQCEKCKKIYRRFYKTIDPPFVKVTIRMVIKNQIKNLEI